MLADYHTHTPFCRHAHGAPEEYAAEALPLAMGQRTI